MKNKPRNSQAVVDAYLAKPDVHDVRREKVMFPLFPAVVSLIMLVLHSLNVYYLFNNGGNVALFLAVHTIFSVITALLAWVRAKAGYDCRFLTMLTLTSAVVGPFGAAGTFFCTLFYLWYRLRAIPFAEWFQSIFPYIMPTLPEAVNEDIVTGRDESSKLYSVIPFLDVIAVGSESQKAQALSKMMLQFHPSFAPAFRMALYDRSNMIRVQAATAVTKIENRFLDRLMKITSVRQAHSQDADVLLALAEHYDNYAYTGILDPEREQTNRTKALESYMEYLKIRPSDAQVRTLVGRLLLRDDQAEAASLWFRESLQLGYHTDTMVLWYLESLYRCGRFRELREQARSGIVTAQIRHQLTLSLSESIALWSGRATVENAA